jgi:hypothetical protein
MMRLKIKKRLVYYFLKSLNSRAKMMGKNCNRQILTKGNCENKINRTEFNTKKGKNKVKYDRGKYHEY